MEPITTLLPADEMLDEVAAVAHVSLVERVVAEEAAAGAAAAVILPVSCMLSHLSSQLTHVSQTLSSIHQVSTMSILQQHRVPLYDDDLFTTLECLDRLHKALEGEPFLPTAGPTTRIAPGFVTANKNTSTETGTWMPITDMPFYESQVHYSYAAQSVPSLTRQFAIDCCQKILPILDERLTFLAAPASAEHAFCECVTQWQHFGGNSIGPCLVNQAMEQFMVREASDYCDQCIQVDEWDATYAPEHCPVPSLTVAEPSSIRILRNRE
jgi:hypothetical protein